MTMEIMLYPFNTIPGAKTKDSTTSWESGSTKQLLSNRNVKTGSKH